jgi:F420-0:gamma-glutamyl ligase
MISMLKDRLRARDAQEKMEEMIGKIREGDLEKLGSQLTYGGIITGSAGLLGQIIGTAIKNGAIVAAIGVLGIIELVHKIGEKFFTTISHGNAIETAVEAMYIMQVICKAEGRELSDLSPAEAKEKYEIAIHIVANLRRKRCFVSPPKEEMQ